MAIKINGNPRLQAYQTEANRKISRNTADFDLGNAGLKKDGKSGEEPGVILEIGKKKTEAGTTPQKAATAKPSAEQQDSYVKTAAAAKETAKPEEGQTGTSSASFAETATKVWNAIKEAVSKFFRALWNGPEKETFPDALEEAERRQEGLGADEGSDIAQAETSEPGVEGSSGTATETITGMQAENVETAGKLAGGATRAREHEDTMEDFLNGTQRAKAVHNTDILTYYDRKGKMVKIRDKGRIIDGK